MKSLAPGMSGIGLGGEIGGDGCARGGAEAALATEPCGLGAGLDLGSEGCCCGACSVGGGAAASVLGAAIDFGCGIGFAGGGAGVGVVGGAAVFEASTFGSVALLNASIAAGLMSRRRFLHLGFSDTIGKSSSAKCLGSSINIPIVASLFACVHIVLSFGRHIQSSSYS